MERQHGSVAVGKLANCRLLGLAAGRVAVGPRRRAELPPHRPLGAVLDDQVLGGRQRGIRKLGDRPSRHCPGRAAPAPHNTTRPRTPPSPPQFASLAAPILAAAGLPGISIGIDSADPTGYSDNDWTENVLTDGKANGFVPSFISDHVYMQAPGAESDNFLLNDTVSDAGSNLDWTTRLQSLISRCSKRLSATRHHPSP